VLEFITNENASQEWLKITNSDGSETSIPQVEKSSTHKENQMRASAGLPLRTHYVINTANGTGYEPSRILNINDNGDKQHRTITYTSKFYGTNYMQEAMLRTLDMTVRRAGR